MLESKIEAYFGDCSATDYVQVLVNINVQQQSSENKSIEYFLSKLIIFVMIA